MVLSMNSTLIEKFFASLGPMSGLEGGVGGQMRHAPALLGSLLDQPSTSIFAPRGTPAQSIFGLSVLVLGICAGIFLVVGGLLLFTIIRYRSRPGDENSEPPQIYGSNQVELSWTVIPILIIVALFLASA
ncbi:MAG: cytochrome c oxidase subunit II transmembrane domain-containing protein, partial [Terracidiphilus sp.]